MALDSKNNGANYVHIRDVKDDKEYFCPCCSSIVKPRAYKDDKEYQVQPHFYHINGECDAESRVHWLYKNWLFKSGSQFYVGDNLYTVKEVVIEKTYHTRFGDYRPDMTVTVDNGKVIFFEVNFTSNKKGNDYFCKWSELNNDVVEVNVKRLLNENYNCSIPKFDLIYSDGKCYKEKYQKRDIYADTIGVMKLKWKRQDKINYKIQWEKLDWFWLELQDYKDKKCGKQDILETFKCIDISDKEFCFDLIRKLNCIKEIRQELRDIINDEMVEFFNKDNINKMISSKVFKLSSIKCEVKKGIAIDYTLKNEAEEVGFHNAIDSKEWIIRYSNAIKIIDKIKRSAYNFERKDDHKKMFCEYFEEAFDMVKNKYFSKDSCIWNIEHSELSHRWGNVEFVVYVSIKDSDAYSNSFDIKYEYYDDDEPSLKDIEDKLLSELKQKMNIINDRLMKYDGKNRKRRRMIVANN